MTNEKVEPEVAASLVAQWSSMLDGKGPICSCVLINDEGVAEEIEVDMTPKEETPKKLIGGRVTFLGQWTDLQVVVMVADKPAEGAKENPHKLPFPFDSADVKGKILLVRMDESATPTNFTQGEYEAFAKDVKENPDKYKHLAAEEEEEEEEDEEGDEKEEEEEDDEDDEEDDEVEFLSDDEDELDSIEDVIMLGVLDTFLERTGRHPTEEEIADIVKQMNEQGVYQRLKEKCEGMLGEQDDAASEDEEEENEGEAPKEEGKEEGIEEGKEEEKEEEKAEDQKEDRKRNREESDQNSPRKRRREDVEEEK